jgi:hypothetical protein
MGKQMKVYVAGGSHAFDRAIAACHMGNLRGAGVDVTLDWTVIMDVPDSELSDDTLASRASAARDAIVRADVVWLIVPAYPSKGSWVEFGYALGLGKLTLVSGDLRSCLFTSLASAAYRSPFDALASIIERARCLAGDVRYTGPDRGRLEERPATKAEENDKDEFPTGGM